MRWSQALLIFGAALLAACLGLVASVALYGPGPLLRSELGQGLLQRWLAEPGPPGLRIAEPGDPMAPIRLADLRGQWRTVPRPGRALLINYWASWCGPCREEMPLLAAYARRQHEGDVDVVGIALDSTAAAQAFLATTPVPFTTLVEAPGERDSSVQLGNRQGVLPFSVLIGADGRLLKRRFGAFDSMEDLSGWAEPAQ